MFIDINKKLKLKKKDEKIENQFQGNFTFLYLFIIFSGIVRQLIEGFVRQRISMILFFKLSIAYSATKRVKQGKNERESITQI